LRWGIDGLSKKEAGGVIKRSFAEVLQPVLKRPGMYVGENPVHLYWYLEGMFEVIRWTLDSPMLLATTFGLELAEKLQPDRNEETDYEQVVMEFLLNQGDSQLKMRFLCDVAGELLMKIDASRQK
jgi:hypothetical protein